MAVTVAILKIYFELLLLNRMAHWLKILIGSIGQTCRSKIAKIILIENPRWSPKQPCWKSILNFFSWTRMAIASNFIGSIEVTCRSKVAKIVLIGNPRWPPSWKSILNSSLEPKDQLTQTCLVMRWAIQGHLSPLVFFCFFFYLKNHNLILKPYIVYSALR